MAKNLPMLMPRWVELVVLWAWRSFPARSGLQSHGVERCVIKVNTQHVPAGGNIFQITVSPRNGVAQRVAANGHAIIAGESAQPPAGHYMIFRITAKGGVCGLGWSAPAD